jgi:hypothetical protein
MGKEETDIRFRRNNAGAFGETIKNENQEHRMN